MAISIVVGAIRFSFVAFITFLIAVLVAIFTSRRWGLRSEGVFAITVTSYTIGTVINFIIALLEWELPLSLHRAARL